MKELSVGEPLAVAGEFTAETYAPAGAEARVNLRIVVDAVLSARKPPKAKSEGARRRPKEANARDRADASWASPTAGGDLDDQIPF